MRILIRTSKWANWGRRLGSLAVPLLVLPILMHRQQLLSGEQFIAVIALAGAVAAATVLVSAIALIELWRSGDQGWGRAISGLLLGTLCLAPFAWYGSLALEHPTATDVFTLDRAELPLVFEPGTADMPPPIVLSATDLARDYPNVSTRTYPLAPEQLYDIVHRLAADRGWTLRVEREPTDTTPGRINAQIMTPPGWREEAVIRIAAGGKGAVVDMRSASLDAIEDFGSNGARIEEFLTSLDTEVTTILRDNPAITQPVDAEPAIPVTTGAE